MNGRNSHAGRRARTVVAQAAACLLAFVAGRAAATQVTLSAFPQNLQFVPRVSSRSYADVPVEGIVRLSSYRKAVLQVTREGVADRTYTNDLSYFNSSAKFEFRVPVPAERAEYGFSLVLTDPLPELAVTSVVGVVAGDVMLVYGQSNASAMRYPFSASAAANEGRFLRSWGTHDDQASTTAADLSWHLAQADAQEGPGAIGQWAARMGRLLVDATGVPLAILNGGEANRTIGELARRDSDPANLWTIYGRLLWRAQTAGVADYARAMFFYQGESDDDANGAVHEAGFRDLCADWAEDYVQLERIYCMQIRAGVPTPKWTLDLRDRQRRFELTIPRVRCVSTTGLNGHDGTHFAYDLGYEELGRRLAAIVWYELYGGPRTRATDSPYPAAALYAGPGSRTVHLLTRDPDDALIFDAGATNDFRVLGSAAVVTNGAAEGNLITLQADGPITNGARLAYSGHSLSGPWVTNAAGVGLFSFTELPIRATLAPPPAPAVLRANTVCGNRVDLSWAPCTDAFYYDVWRGGGFVARCFGTSYVDRAVGPGTNYGYTVWSVNPAGSNRADAAVATFRHGVFAHVPSARDYTLLFKLESPFDYDVLPAERAPYTVDRSGEALGAVQSVAYCLELAWAWDRPADWVFVSMSPFGAALADYGLPVQSANRVFQQSVESMTVWRGGAAGVTEGRGLGSGNIEFWWYDAFESNISGVPNASDTVLDAGDAMYWYDDYGSFQIHNHSVKGTPAAETVLAFNGWAAPGVDDVGFGNSAGTTRDWTRTRTARRLRYGALCVLVKVDADADGLPDGWEEYYFGHTGYGGGDDPDHDGASNAAEYTAGSDPSSAASPLGVRLAGTGVEVLCDSLRTREYDVERATGLQSAAWIPVASNVAGTGGLLAVPVPAGGPRDFYRLRVRRTDP